MTAVKQTFGDRCAAAAVRKVGGLSPWTQKVLSGGGRVVVDGMELHPEMRMIITLLERSGGMALNEMSVVDARADLRRTAALLGGRSLPVREVKDLAIQGHEGPLTARLYSSRDETDTLLVFFHGGGFVVGDLESHDQMCRFLAIHGSTKVLAVDYRLAPEHPFPAAPLDAYAAFRWALESATDLGIDPRAIAVGGDSAGANLAASVCLQARDSGCLPPTFQLLFFPSLDLSSRPESYRTFGTGYVLTSEVIEWYFKQYLSSAEHALDPLASPMLAPSLADLPPAYVATAGFDPVRDDGEKFVGLLRRAGVPVAHRRHEGLLHGFSIATGFGTQSAAAMHEAAGALRTGLALGGRSAVGRGDAAPYLRGSAVIPIGD